MGNTQTSTIVATTPPRRAVSRHTFSDREVARQLIENKRQRSVQFFESESSLESCGDGMNGVKSPSLRSKSLRGNLMRQQKDRDPLFYYEIIKVVGVGSMGSVAMVRKRVERIGGSARQELVDSLRRQKKQNECFQIPVVGKCFQFCIEKSGAAGKRMSHSDSRSNLLYTEKDSGMPLTMAASQDSQYEVTYALKSIHLNRVTDKSFIEELKNEIEILKDCDHPHIVKPIETFVHRNQLYIVMELCWGGDLYSRDPYTEDEAARIAASILSAVRYMHSRKIVHRDLKYENILFAHDGPMAEIKLIDFGLSKKYASDKELTEGVGTIYTMAPEVLKGTYTSQADLWSVGVIAYMLLSSQMPFYGRKRSHIVEQIMSCEYDFKGRRWKRVSSQAKSFVEDMLVADPEDRATASEAQQSMWLNKRFSATARAPTLDEFDTTAESMQKYAGYSHLKKLALMVIAHKSTSAEIGVLRKIFQRYDTQKDGTIGLPEFREALSKYGYPDEEVAQMFEAVDIDGSGIKYTEFLAATIEAHGTIDENRLAEAFDRLDSDDSGYICKENLREILGDGFPAERIEEIIKEADLTDDHKISYPEFLALWEDRPHLPPSRSFQVLPTVDAPSFESDEASSERLSMREENLAEATSLGRSNFIEGKKYSERKAEEAYAIDVQAATVVVLNTLDEIVEDDEAELTQVSSSFSNGDSDHPSLNGDGPIANMLNGGKAAAGEPNGDLKLPANGQDPVS